MTTSNAKPAATIRDGSLKATIWKKTGENGDYFSVQLTRTWKDAQGNYHDSDSFTGADLGRTAGDAATDGHSAARLADLHQKVQAADDRAAALRREITDADADGNLAASTKL